jgi:hypothetical protein
MIDAGGAAMIGIIRKVLRFGFKLFVLGAIVGAGGSYCLEHQVSAWLHSKLKSEETKSQALDAGTRSEIQVALGMNGSHQSPAPLDANAQASSPVVGTAPPPPAPKKWELIHLTPLFQGSFQVAGWKAWTITVPAGGVYARFMVIGSVMSDKPLF